MKKLTIFMALLMVCILVFIGCGETATPTTSAPAPTTSAPAPTTSAPKPTTSAPAPTTSAPKPTATATVARTVLEGPQANMPTVGETPQPGGDLKILYRKALSNIGAPWKGIGGPDKFTARFIHEALTGDGPDGYQVPQLATSWDINKDAKTVTLNLRKGVMFQDGTPFNADAVKWNLEKNRSVKNPGATNIMSIDIVDPYTVVLHLAEYDPLFLSTLASGAANMMVSPTNAEKWGDAVVTHPCGTGPFEMVSFEPDVVVKMKKFDGYWQKGLPYLDTLEVHQVADPVVAYTSFISGEVLFFEGISADQVNQSKEKGFKSNFMISAIMGIGWDSVSENSPFHDVRVRQAVAHAINMPDAVEAAFSGMYTSTNQISAPGFSSYNPDIVAYAYDTAKAKELATLAGYGPGNPYTCKFSYGESPDSTDLATIYQAHLADIGINLNLDPLSRSAWGSFIQGEMHNQMSEWNVSFQLSFPYSYGLLQGLTMGQQYKSVWVPDDYMTLFNTMYFEADLAKREAYYRQLNKMAIDDYCLVVPAYLRTNYKGVSPKLHDLGMGEVSGDFLPEIIWFEH